MTLPNFLIAGAPKAGTTSLYHMLRQHPDVFMSALKETNYFCHEEYPREEAWIRSAADYERLFAGARGEGAVGEASPKYLHSETAPGRIARELPQCRLVFSLRHPVDRAYSNYLDWLRAGQERRPPHQALQPGTGLLETSLYCDALRRYFDRFPRERIHVVLFDDLQADPAAVARALFRFLSVDPAVAVETAARNVSRVPSFPLANAMLVRTVAALKRLVPVSMWNTGLANRAQRVLLREPDPLAPDLRRELLAHFREDIRRTGDLISRDLSHWLE